MSKSKRVKLRFEDRTLIVAGGDDQHSTTATRTHGRRTVKALAPRIFVVTLQEPRARPSSSIQRRERIWNQEIKISRLAQGSGLCHCVCKKLHNLPVLLAQTPNCQQQRTSPSFAWCFWQIGFCCQHDPSSSEAHQAVS